MSHISKRLSEAQAVTILTQYVEKKISSADAQAKLGLKRSRFFDLVRAFQKDKQTFTIVRDEGERKTRISKNAETHIKDELAEEKKLIDNKDVPVRSYNYYAVHDTLKYRYPPSSTAPKTWASTFPAPSERCMRESSPPILLESSSNTILRIICSRHSCTRSSTSLPRSTITLVFFCLPIFSSKRRAGIISRVCAMFSPCMASRSNTMSINILSSGMSKIGR